MGTIPHHQQPKILESIYVQSFDIENQLDKQDIIGISSMKQNNSSIYHKIKNSITRLIIIKDNSTLPY